METSYLEQVLIEWCDKNISVGNWKPENIPKGAKAMYSDGTGASGHDSFYLVFLMPDKTYKVRYCDSYTDIPTEDCPERIKDCKNIREVIMFVVFHDFDYSYSQSRLFQMMLNGVSVGYDGKREDVKNLIDLNCEKKDGDLRWHYKPKYEKDYLLKKLNIPLSVDKCTEVDNYYVPDLSKCDDTDTEFINMIKKQIDTDMEYMDRK